MAILFVFAFPTLAGASEARQACRGAQGDRPCPWSATSDDPTSVGCTAGAEITFTGQISGSYLVPPERRLGVTVLTSNPAYPNACTIAMTLPGRGGKDLVTIGGPLPKPLAPGSYRVAKPWPSPPGGGPGWVTVMSSPSCDRAFDECRKSNGFYRGDAGEAGLLELSHVTRDRVEGSFSASMDRSYRFETTGTFIAGLTGIGNTRLQADHPCLPTCPPPLEVPVWGPDDPRGLRDPVLSMSPEEFARDPVAQDKLFAMAKDVRARQEQFGEHLLASTAHGGAVESILKRDTKADFVAGVVAKAHRNDYRAIGEMDDMVRGRFDLCHPDDVKKLAEILLYSLPVPGETGSDGTPVEGPFVLFPKTELPRRPIQAPECACEEGGYPRYHVIVQDAATGITHEWQIGTGAVSDVYEVAGVTFPPEMWLDFETGVLGPDLHDIDYDIFRQGVKKHDRAYGDDQYERLGLATFSESIDRLSAAAHCQGYELEKLDERISALHAEASLLLQRVVDHYGIEQVRKWYH